MKPRSKLLPGPESSSSGSPLQEALRDGRGQASDAMATVLFTAQVAEWQEVSVDAAVDPSELEAFLADQARSAGIDPTRPFPFVLSGNLEYLRLHVIGGECPMRARMQFSSGKAG